MVNLLEPNAMLKSASAALTVAANRVMTILCVSVGVALVFMVSWYRLPFTVKDTESPLVRVPVNACSTTSAVGLTAAAPTTEIDLVAVRLEFGFKEPLIVPTGICMLLAVSALISRLSPLREAIRLVSLALIAPTRLSMVFA